MSRAEDLTGPAPKAPHAPEEAGLRRRSPIAASGGSALLLFALLVPGAAPLLAQEEAPAGEAAKAVASSGDACRVRPLFVDNARLEGAAALGTAVRGHTGLVLKEYDHTGRVRHIHKHPSWENAGHLGAFVYTERGDVFVAPAPLVSLLENPPEKQNRLYRVDSRDARMQPFVELPAASEPSVANPFGVIGLAYDCATRSLYAASVAGSTPHAALGRIHRVDARTGEHEIVLEGFDAFGLGIRVNGAERRLYFGSARDTGVYSAPLDDQGSLSAPPRLEFHLAAFEGGGNEKAKSIDFRTDGEMRVTAFDFHYTLKASGHHRLRHYRLRWSDPDQRWELINVSITQGES